MKYIDENKINELLARTKNASEREVDEVLNRSLSLKRLSLEDTAKLLAVDDPILLDKLFKTAKEVKQRIYGKRIVLFAPLYISNY